MRTRIKFCGLVRPEDVDAAVRLGVDAIGFVFYEPSPRYLEAESARTLRRRLPSFVVAVGLFVNAAPALIARTRDTVGLDVIQLHGDEGPEQAAALGLRHWKAHRIAADYDLSAAIAAHRAAEYHLLDSASPGFGGSGLAFDWARAQGHDGSRLIVSGGIDGSNVGAAIEQLEPFAVDTSSGIQGGSARVKDLARMEAFVEAVRAADGKRAATAAGG